MKFPERFHATWIMIKNAKAQRTQFANMPCSPFTDRHQMQELDKGVVTEKTHVHKTAAGCALPKALSRTRQQTRKTQMLTYRLSLSTSNQDF
jgi:hypothetical protein